MTAEKDLFERERQFWSEVADADFYRSHSTDNAVMVFPAPYGVMERDENPCRSRSSNTLGGMRLH